MLHLQRTIGNQSVLRLLRASAEGLQTGPDIPTDRFANDFRLPVFSTAPVEAQTKLKVSTPGDTYEQEADRLSESVMRMPDSGIDQTGSASSILASSCRTAGRYEGGERISKAMTAGRVFADAPAAGVAAPAAVHEVLGSPGQPLDSATRRFMEPRFGRDFSHVRIHVDARADDSARALNALAYTVGPDVVFGAGRYAPHTVAGRQLIAHELTHVLQQGSDRSVIRRAITYPVVNPTRADPILRVLRAEHALALTKPTVNGSGFPRETDPATTIIKAAFAPGEYRTIDVPSSSGGSGSGSSGKETPAPGSGSGSSKRETPAPGSGSGSSKKETPAPGSGSGDPGKQAPGSGSGSAGSGGPATPSECAFKDFDVRISADMILPTDPTGDHWGPDYVDAADVPGLPPVCSGKTHIEVKMKGQPDTPSFFQKVKANEWEHVTDLKAAAGQYLVPHYEAIMALRGKGQDPDACKADLQTKLGQVPEDRIRAFHAKVIADADGRDLPGQHPTEEATHIKPDCSGMEITGKSKPGPTPAPAPRPTH